MSALYVLMDFISTRSCAVAGRSALPAKPRPSPWYLQPSTFKYELELLGFAHAWTGVPTLSQRAFRLWLMGELISRSTKLTAYDGRWPLGHNRALPNAARKALF